MTDRQLAALFAEQFGTEEWGELEVIKDEGEKCDTGTEQDED